MTKTDNVKTVIMFLPMMVNTDQKKNNNNNNSKTFIQLSVGLNVDIIT